MSNHHRSIALSLLLIAAIGAFARLERAEAREPLPGTQQLELEGDLAALMVEGIDRFLLRETAAAPARRAEHWQRDTTSPEHYSASVAPNRERFARYIGAVDERVADTTPHLLAAPGRSALVGRGDGFEVFRVRWLAFGDVSAEGLLLVPVGLQRIADIVAIPDAAQSPEGLAGLTDELPSESQFARRLAESGCRVLVPCVIDRQPGGYDWGVRQHKITNREFLYRSAFELGRHLIGYEVQKVLAGVDWFADEEPLQDTPIGVGGYGEGGLLALYAAALDERIDAALVSGYFDSRQDLWQEPLDRNVFALLEEFGDAEIASLVAPRRLIIEASAVPDVVIPPGTGGGPGRLVTPDLARVEAEVERARQLTAGLPDWVQSVSSGDGHGPFGTTEVLSAFLSALHADAQLAPPGSTPRAEPEEFDPLDRMRRQMHEIDRHSQAVLARSADLRRQYFAELKTDSLGDFQDTIEPYREAFRHEVIGHFDRELLPANPRTRKVYDQEAFTGYEVVLDVFPDVFAYGILLVPKGIAEGERRPVVVCQHGLEGRPTDVADPGVNHPAYSQYAVQLARRGFITFAPQNPYIGGDRFRTLQRKANPLKKTLFSIIVPQHQQIVDWLASLPAVDPQRIAFYGLSYGGKTAMRVPALVDRYCLSICSADFNEWVWKNASTSSPYSYVWTGEYEIFEFDLGSTFNYAEMAALIAPRPFMVERGHFDGVAPDETVGYEFAKVRHLYAARLGIGDRCKIEWFVGPHEINGVGTFAFLHQHLKWPLPE